MTGLAIGSAFWLGLLTAISPCPLATNIAAIVTEQSAADLAARLEKESLHFERKYRDPDGVIFDISQNGWVGARK